MGQVISVSAPAMDLMLYGNKTDLINNYLVQQMQQIKPAFNEFSNRIYQSLQNSYNFVNDKLIQYGLMNQLQQQGVQTVQDCTKKCEDGAALLYKQCMDQGAGEAACQNVGNLQKESCTKKCALGY